MYYNQPIQQVCHPSSIEFYQNETYQYLKRIIDKKMIEWKDVLTMVAMRLALGNPGVFPIAC